MASCSSACYEEYQLLKRKLAVAERDLLERDLLKRELVVAQRELAMERAHKKAKPSPPTLLGLVHDHAQASLTFYHELQLMEQQGQGGGQGGGLGQPLLTLGQGVLTLGQGPDAQARADALAEQAQGAAKVAAQMAEAAAQARCSRHPESVSYAPPRVHFYIGDFGY